MWATIYLIRFVASYLINFYNKQHLTTYQNKFKAALVCVCHFITFSIEHKNTSSKMPSILLLVAAVALMQTKLCQCSCFVLACASPCEQDEEEEGRS